MERNESHFEAEKRGERCDKSGMCWKKKETTGVLMSRHQTGQPKETVCR